MQVYEQVREKQPEMADRIVFLTGGTTAEEARDFLSGVTNARAFEPVEGSELMGLIDRAAQEATVATLSAP